MGGDVPSLDPDIELGRVLRGLRGQMSQVRFAARLGVSNKTVSRYERGLFEDNGQPRASVLFRWAYAARAEPAEILNLAGLEYSEDDAASARATLRSSEVRARP